MTTEDYPEEEDSWWFPVFLTLFLLILVLNAFTITAYTRLRHLRKRSTYLIINLTVADLLVGAVTGPLILTHDDGHHGLEWGAFLRLAFELVFTMASQVNLCLISLDRLHATLFPFKHCLIDGWFYFKVIIFSWFIAFLLASLMAGLELGEFDGYWCVWVSFNILTLLVLAVSYVIIIVNVQSNPHSQHQGLIHTERKLTVTLSIVTGLSVLTILPWAVYRSMPVFLMKKWWKTSGVDIDGVLSVTYYASSIVNPLVYAIRMQEFRKAIRNLVCKRNDMTNVHPLPHHAMEMQ